MPGEEFLRLWSHALVAGISNDLFWELTVREIEVVLNRREEEERRENLRAGLIAAAIYNVHRKRGTPAFHPRDFIRERPRPQDYMSKEQARAFLDGWAADRNAEHQREGGTT